MTHFLKLRLALLWSCACFPDAVLGLWARPAKSHSLVDTVVQLCVNLCNTRNFSQPHQIVLSILNAFWAQERYLSSLSCLSHVAGNSFRKSSALLVFSLQVLGFAPWCWRFMWWSVRWGQTELTQLSTTAVIDVVHLVTELPTAISLKHNTATHSKQPLPHAFFPHIASLSHQIFTRGPLLVWGIWRGFYFRLTLRRLVTKWLLGQVRHAGKCGSRRRITLCGCHQGCAVWEAEPLGWQVGKERGKRAARLAVSPPGMLLGPVAEHCDLRI